MRRTAFTLLGLTLALAACSDSSASGTTGECPPTTSAGGSGQGGTGAGSSMSQGGGPSGPTTGTGSGFGGGVDTGADNSGNNEFDHMNDPGNSGKKDPFEILKEHADEGPPEIRSRLHGCTKLRYDALGALLSSRGVNLTATGTPKTAGQLYAEGKDALGVAKLDAREAEAYFHTTSGATKLFDIFVQASTEIIANIESAPACQINGVGFPMFDAADGSCVRESLSCVMGRPATDEDLLLCDLMVSQNDGTPTDINRKRQIAVAAFLSAAHTCE